MPSSRSIALCYLRKSDVRVAADLVSIEIQRAAIAGECQYRGLVPEWYEDADGHRSGRHESGRPEFVRLKGRIPDPDVAAVIGYRLDRISRSVRDFVALLENCKEAGVAVITADRKIDTSGGLDAFATIQLNMLAAIAQFESDAASDRIREHVSRKGSAGISHGRPPFGMSRHGRGVEAKFRANEDAPAAIRALELYASGLSYDATAERLNSEGARFRARAGHPTRWGRESVRTVVGNVLFYSGYFSAENWDAKNARITLADGPGDHVERYARAIDATLSPAIEPAIPRTLANLTIERRHKNQAAGRRGLVPFVLSPVAHWNGRKLRGQITPAGRRYTTRGAGPWIDADVAEEAVVALLSRLKFPPELRAHIHAFALADLAGDRLRALQDRAREAERYLALLLDLLRSDRIARPLYDAEYARTERELRDVQAELARPTEVDEILAQLSDLGSSLAYMAPEARKRNILRVVERVDLAPDGSIERLRLRPAAARAFKTAIDIHSKIAEGGDRGQFRNALRAIEIAAN